MTSCPVDVVAIGDAIVDVIATAEDSFLVKHGLIKGSMRLLDADEARHLYSEMGPAREISGGSAANSMAGVAALGLSAAFIGQIANDQLGAIFAHDMQSLGVQFATPALSAPPPTGNCFILVTPDAQRTMSTYPGASHELTAEALDHQLIRSASVTFLEGYLWGPDRPRGAMLEAARIARSAGRIVAFTLSESLCIGDHREGVLGMIDAGLIDILFGNEDEFGSLTDCTELADSIRLLSRNVETLIATRGPKGAVGCQNGKILEIAAIPVSDVVDTTGAGDLFAAGFIAAHCRGRDIATCLGTGSIAAAEIISHFGARPESDLKELVAL